MYAAGFRFCDELWFDGVRVVVITGPNKRVCDVLIFDKDEAGKPKVLDAFCKQSYFDNFSIVDGEVFSKGETVKVPGRCVEVAVFMGLKYVLTQSGVQMLGTDDEATRKLLVDTADAIPRAVKKLLAKKPELDRSDDPLVKACKAWPSDPLDVTKDLAALKNDWIHRNRVVLECIYTDPKLAKLGVGRAVSMELMGGRFFDKDLKLALTAISCVRVAYLMCNESALAFCLGVKHTEEISDCDDFYALKVEEMPEGKGVLDFFLPGGDRSRKEALVKHMREKAPAYELGKANQVALSLALDAYLQQEFQETEATKVLRSVGWDDWFNNGLGLLDASRGLSQDVLRPVVQFQDTGRVMAVVDGTYGVKEIVDELVECDMDVVACDMESAA